MTLRRSERHSTATLLAFSGTPGHVGYEFDDFGAGVWSCPCCSGVCSDQVRLLLVALGPLVPEGGRYVPTNSRLGTTGN
jgi:hypothetical protein